MTPDDTSTHDTSQQPAAPDPELINPDPNSNAWQPGDSPKDSYRKAVRAEEEDRRKKEATTKKGPGYCKLHKKRYKDLQGHMDRQHTVDEEDVAGADPRSSAGEAPPEPKVEVTIEYSVEFGELLVDGILDAASFVRELFGVHKPLRIPGGSWKTEAAVWHARAANKYMPPGIGRHLELLVLIQLWAKVVRLNTDAGPTEHNNADRSEGVGQEQPGAPLDESLYAAARN